MAEKKKREGLTRRDFIKTIGIAGIASTRLDIGKAEAVPEKAEAEKPILPRRKLGKTGAEVSVLALGGGFDTINNQLLLRQAHNWGVNFWDTAENYGNGSSEEGYGLFLSRNKEARGDIFLATKVHTGEPEAMSAALDKCLKRLATDHVDLLHVHGIGDFSEIAEPKPVSRWASGLKRAGKIKLFGFSTHSNMEKCLLDASKAGWIDVIMFAYSFRLMNSPNMKEAIAACADKGVGLVAMKTQGGRQQITDSEAELKMTERFLERGFTDKQAKIKVVLENPNIASVCSLMPNMTILSANVAVACDQTSLTLSDYEWLEKFAAETRGSFCAGCSRICQEAVAGAVPVSDIMRCLMYYRDYGERDLAREVFARLHSQARANFAQIDYSRAEKACPQKLAISKLMREASEILV